MRDITRAHILQDHVLQKHAHQKQNTRPTISFLLLESFPNISEFHLLNDKPVHSPIHEHKLLIFHSEYRLYKT